MSISMDEALSQMGLTMLVELSTDELKRHRSKEPFDDRYCVEILRRALVEQTDEAWSVLHQCFSETIRIWIHSHHSSYAALLYDSEENYIAQTFSRFWYAVRDQRITFTTLYAALSYLHATLNGVMMDTLRSNLRFHSREMPFPEPDSYQEPVVEDSINGQGVWDSIQFALNDERERRLAYLLYYCGLKPRDIVMRCSQEFSNVKEVYRLNSNIITRLRRNRERLRNLLVEAN